MKNKKITFEEAKQRFLEQGRNDLILCEDGYVRWTKKSKFFDKNANDYFFAVPKSVYTQKSSHPKNKYQKLKKNLLEKCGVDNVSKLNEVKEKKRNTCMKNFGTNCIFQSSEIKEKIKNTNIEKYGETHFLKTKEGINKLKESNKQKYGVSNISQLFEIKEKIKLINNEKYGVDHVSKSNFFKKCLSKRFIIETDQHLHDWLKEQPKPKPGYSTLAIFFKNRNIKLSELEEYIKNYKDHKTQLEVFGEKIFNTSHYNRKINKNIKYKPDFKLSETVYVNVDGLYWHSEEQKDKNYHFEMRKKFEENKLRLFQFYDSEIKDKSDIIKSIVNNCLGNIENSIFARKCEIKNVEQKEANDFLTVNHLMGPTNAKHIGLYYNQQLVSLLSFKEIKNICKIERFCSLTNHNVAGGFTKLLKHLECNLLKPSTAEIHNWVDLRYGTGEHLESKSFKLIKETIGWKWTDFENNYNRLYCRANMDERKLSEKEHAEELGLYKIYDAGQRLYVKYL